MVLESGPTQTATHKQGTIRVAGARTHNLKNLSLEIPRDQFVVITGLSGSGKSSLVFDTLAAEGQRRYLQTVSVGRRGLLDQLERPDVDAIAGLPPILSVNQRSGSSGARSTLATATEIADRLRLLYARAGQAHSPHGGRPLERQTLDEIVSAVVALGDRVKAMILAPLVRGRSGEHREVFEKISKEGFVRARVNGEVVDTAEPPSLAANEKHDIEAVVDRIIIKDGIGARLRESIELALKLGEGICIVTHAEGDNWGDRLYSEHFVCPETGEGYPPLEPRSFSFNNPRGACPACHGLGVLKGGKEDDRGGGNRICPECGGERLNNFSRLVTFDGMRFPEFLARTVEQARERSEVIYKRLQEDELSLPLSVTGRLAARKIMPELIERLRYLEQVGLGYLTLDRRTKTLSGGEFQRSRLASAIGSGLVGVCYILDEPTIGLHPRDIQKLVGALINLRDAGNSVLIVEHDLAVIAAADTVIEIGPGAGSDGGSVTAVGTPLELARRDDTATGPFLAGRNDSDSSPARPVDATTPRLRLLGITRNNLRKVDVDFPLGRFVTVTGVSGSGKSTLITEVLVPLTRAALSGEERMDQCGRIDAASDLPERLVLVDQSPLGRSGRSVPATYCGVWEEIRRLFAATREAKQRGYKAGRFSFLSPAGRCDQCAGRGTITLSMSVLPDLLITCPSCEGRRFNGQTLSVTYKDKSVADILDMRIDEAAVFFEGIARVSGRLSVFMEVGLGYLTLGQSALTLSGGEAQRVRLASELAAPGDLAISPTLFVLDEPTTGLHPADSRRLVALLQRLVEAGHSVIAIEHEPAFIAASDWVIDLGPEGGDGGGWIVAECVPGELGGVAASYTGAALAGYLS